MTTRKYRRKPIVLEAVQLRRDNLNEVMAFVNAGRLIDGYPQVSTVQHEEDTWVSLFIPTVEGVMQASENDWIVRGTRGEVYPVKPDIFKETYEEA